MTRTYKTILTIVLCIAQIEARSSEVDLNKFLELARKNFKEGQLMKALNHFELANGLDSNNHFIYIQKCSVYLALKQYSKALQQIDKALEIKPNFQAGLIQQVNIYLNLGDYHNAELSLNKIKLDDSNNMDVSELIQQVKWAKDHEKFAEQYLDNDVQNASFHLNKAIQYSPWNAKFYKLRSRLYLNVEENLLVAISDLTRANELDSNNLDTLLKLSQLFLKNENISLSAKFIRHCLKLDPENRECLSFYKLHKKTFKSAPTENLDLNVKITDNTNETNIIFSELNVVLCKAFFEERFYLETILSCSDALESNNFYFDDNKLKLIFYTRARAYFTLGLYQDAITDFKNILKIDPKLDIAISYLERAESSKAIPNYYSILGVDTSSSKTDIINAYNKMAQKYNPIKYTNILLKETVQRKLNILVEAKTMLLESLTKDRTTKPSTKPSKKLSKWTFQLSYHYASPDVELLVEVVFLVFSTFWFHYFKDTRV